jgi:hypothetical protein
MILSFHILIRDVKNIFDSQKRNLIEELLLLNENVFYNLKLLADNRYVTVSFFETGPFSI